MSDTPETDAFYGELHPEQGLREHARSLERRLQEAEKELENAQIKADEAWNETYQAALREVEEHKSRCTVLEAEVAEWKSQFAAALAEKGKP